MDHLIEQQFREQIKSLRDGAVRAMNQAEECQEIADKELARKQEKIARANNFTAMADMIERKILGLIPA